MRLPIRHLVLLALMLASAALAAGLRPTVGLADERPAVDLQAMVPTQFGAWRELPNAAVHIVDPELQRTIDRIYTQTLTRNYVDGEGNRIMLSIAYGKRQTDTLQLHLPEVCYPAQGFKLDHLEKFALALGNQTIAARRMQTHLGQRVEPVTYWTVVGDHVTVGGLSKKIAEMRYGLAGRIPDGMLVRISSIDRDAARAHRIQAEFAAALVAAIAPEHRPRFAGVAALPDSSRPPAP